MEIVYSKEFDFIPKLQLSKSRRAVYYTQEDFLKGKLPKKFILQQKGIITSPCLKSPYKFITNNLYNEETKEFVIKNTKSVGRPRYWVINGQSIYSGNIPPQQRSVLMAKLHEYFKELIGDCPKINLIDKERYQIKYLWYLLEDKVYPDVSNLWPYGKAINDVLVKDLKVVEDDSPKYHKQDKYDTEYRETEGFKIEIIKI